MASRRLGLRPPRPKQPEAAGASRAVRVVASVAANVTLLTALLYYFGFLYTQVFFSYFRVHYTVLGQAADEILARGVDGLLLPIAGGATATLAVFGTIRVLRSRLPEDAWSALLRVGKPVAAVTGLVLIGLAVPVAINPDAFREYAGLPGLGLAVGVVLLVFSWRTVTVAEWLVTYLLVAFGLFWAVGDYSREVGTRRAYETAQRLPTRPVATLYSTRSLNLTEIAELECDAVFKFRYTGLKLLLQSSGQYVFVPDGWDTTGGATFVIPRSDTLRLEFTPAGVPESC